MQELANPLNAIMEFDHVIEVRADGSIIERSDLYAPSLFEGELDNDDWSLLDGYSGQYSYSGPVMHDSEYIGGRMERDIRETPGVYVAVVNYYEDDDTAANETDSEGWAVAYIETD
jgi:hypothetical protein